MTEQKAASSPGQITPSDGASVPTEGGRTAAGAGLVMTPKERMDAVARMQSLAGAHHAALPPDCTYCGVHVGEVHGEPCITAIRARKTGAA